MPDLSDARRFYDGLPQENDAAFASLASLLGNVDAEENLWRDYKAADYTRDDPKRDQKVKDVWSENLSAFANTGGGVLIWGIETEGKIPKQLSLAPDCRALRDRLLTLVNVATDPHVSGVEARAVTEPRGEAGFVVCSIPASSVPPHRAIWGKPTFFIRTQDSCLPCPTALLRSLFFPRVRARIIVRVDFSASHTASLSNLMFSCAFHIANRGPATAESVIVAVEAKGANLQTIHAGSCWETVAHQSFRRCKFPIPPNLVVPDPINVGGSVSVEGCSLKLLIFVHDMPSHASEFAVTQAQLDSAARSREPIRMEIASNPVMLG